MIDKEEKGREEDPFDPIVEQIYIYIYIDIEKVV